jgi:uncharacterized membrane protein YwzB
MDPITLSLLSIAPQLVKWISGNDKAEQVTSIAVGLAKKVAGIEDAPAAIAAIQADPKLAAEFADKLSEREAVLDKAYLADTADARAMQVAALQQDDLFSKRFIYFFSAAWSLYAMIYMMWVTFGNVANENLANIILGFLLGTAVSAIFGFFYGSTKKSQERSDMVFKAMAK